MREEHRDLPAPALLWAAQAELNWLVAQEPQARLVHSPSSWAIRQHMTGISATLMLLRAPFNDLEVCW
eukprot:CAMPEP_0168435680 /NCGR_PEP_ID=MMETSP0228-20121227/40538_1 /TAXON_ID=133427 /ORGANISM="Protoceratium reticulatum, Strain CCCM 535 (=CCMP 1889)" /LENGTH=67 /DNA_ID=CAMNT_0008449859 /DNA_START=24 /DNA_END=224 /DNA_ORIENTATION=+